jgi:hypothetical protein
MRLRDVAPFTTKHNALWACSAISTTTPYYTHQVIELLQIEMSVTHVVLHECVVPGVAVSSKLIFVPSTVMGMSPG